jgi:peptidoglycan/xylan/chitin deacetylase (PgdA/CDA1 family)
MLLPVAALCAAQPVEVHHVLELQSPEDKVVALTLDACGGEVDADLLAFLVRHRIPATVFATRKWLVRHPDAVALLNARSDLFDVEDHGERHVPAIIGAGRSVRGIPGNADPEQLRREVLGGAKAVEAATGRLPRWYRGAGGEYDPLALEIIESLGLGVAGFSLNADDGATLTRQQIVRRLQRAKNGDIIIAHVNKPGSDTAEGLAAGLKALQERGFRFVTLRDARLRVLKDVAPTRQRRAAGVEPPRPFSI